MKMYYTNVLRACGGTFRIWQPVFIGMLFRIASVSFLRNSPYQSRLSMLIFVFDPTRMASRNVNEPPLDPNLVLIMFVCQRFVRSCED
ncbi:hypothetical protein DOTSEDRAFT_74561 [Dothistroma septosporum NZE10]|uniref:Uncharacterized protein n=1 Tax=Dothistroma septosporum (strain NZE10 / CBS 128990) TaxID=675120 RepID=N1PIC1_DOTSN|nr:hypothetical protein DOTSEDRAFT_74561 [Dothistroma septosporum NZE10]